MEDSIQRCDHGQGGAKLNDVFSVDRKVTGVGLRLLLTATSMLGVVERVATLCIAAAKTLVLSGTTSSSAALTVEPHYSGRFH